MSCLGTSEQCTRRSSWGIVWTSPRRKNIGIKSLEGWILLAHDDEKFSKVHEEMSEMPVTCKFPQHPGGGIFSNHVPMAIFQMGNRPPRSLPPGCRISEILDSCYWLLHEVDWSGATLFHHGCTSPEVCLAKYLYSIWNSRITNHRQWDVISQSKISGLPFKLQGSTPFNIGRASTS